MRFIQNTLLVIVATVSGAVAGWFAAYLGMSSILKPPMGENFGGGYFWLACMAGGAVLMALTGLVGTLSWIARHESRPWSPIVWLGIGLGVAVGLAVQFDSFDAFFQAAFQRIGVLLKGLLVSGACGVLGGVLASLALWIEQRRRSPRNPAPGPARPRR